MTITRKDLYLGLLILALIMFGNSYYAGKRQGELDAKRDQAIEEVKQGLASIQKDRETVKSPAQVAAVVPRYTPEVHPVLVVPGGVPTEIQASGDHIPQISLPDAPSAIPAGSLVILKDNVPAYWASVTKCAEDGVKLTGCQQELDLEKKKHTSRFRNCLVSVGTNTASGAVFGGGRGAIVGAGFGTLGCLLTH